MFTHLKCTIFVLFCGITACSDATPEPVHPAAERFLPGSVELLIEGARGELLCSGVLVSPDVVATARHCTYDATRIRVFEPDSGHMSLVSHVVEDPIQDRAEAHTMTAFPRAATMGDVFDHRPVRVQGFGCAQGVRLEQRPALFYGLGGEHARQMVWAGRGCGGDSGGGIWNADGRLVAILTEAGFVYDHGRRINIVVGELL